MKLIKDYPEGTQWQTRRGSTARHLGTLRNGKEVFAVDLYGFESVWERHPDGRVFDDGESHPDDIIPVPVKRTGWVNVYPAPDGAGFCADTRGVWPTKAYADGFADSHRIACIQIEWTDGEGL